MARILRGYELDEHIRQQDDMAWMRSTWRGFGQPLSGVLPQSFEVAPGLLMIRQIEYLSAPCARCGFVDNYCTWDMRLSVRGPGHRELNRWLCQRCHPEFVTWLKESKTPHVHVTAWLDLPDDTLNAWLLRRATDAPCLTKDAATTAAAA